MKVRIEIPMEEAFTLEERMNFEANARLAGRDLCTHLRAILFPPAAVDARVAATTATKALACDPKARAKVKFVSVGASVAGSAGVAGKGNGGEVGV